MGLELPNSEPAILAKENFGLAENIPLIQQHLTIEAPEHQKVNLQIAIFIRDQTPTQQDSNQNISPIPNQQENDAIFMSGFGTRSQDWPVAFAGLSRYWKNIVGIDHPDAPTSKIEPHDKPLNHDSFANSGFVILRAIETKILDQTVKPGVTAIGLSTGCPVLLEAVAQDIRETEAGLHERYIKSLILSAPAGMMERDNFTQIAMGASSGMMPYFKNEYARNLLFRIFHPRSSGTHREPLQRMSFKELRQKWQEADNNPNWKSVLTPHKSFDLMEYITQYLPVDDLMAYFHRIWPNQDPHFLPSTPSIKQNESLIWHNVTDESRNIIKATDIRIELFDGDQAVPPEGFLDVTDRQEINSTALTKDDLQELDEINSRRLEPKNRSDDHKNKKVEPYLEDWMLENKRQEKTLELIIKRVKNLFPNNADSTHVAINIGTTHITPKVTIDMILDRHTNTKI
jgi:hypothetical protein